MNANTRKRRTTKLSYSSFLFSFDQRLLAFISGQFALRRKTRVPALDRKANAVYANVPPRQVSAASFLVASLARLRRCNPIYRAADRRKIERDLLRERTILLVTTTLVPRAFGRLVCQGGAQLTKMDGLTGLKDGIMKNNPLPRLDTNRTLRVQLLSLHFSRSVGPLNV